MQIFKSANFNFIGNRNKSFLFSGLLILATIVSLLIPRGAGQRFGLNMSIDFVGGTLVQLQFQKPVSGDLSTVRSIVSQLGYGNPEVKTIGHDGTEIQIVVKGRGADAPESEASAIAEEIRQAIMQGYPSNGFEVRRQEKVGPKIGGELQRAAILGCLLSFAALIIYVGVRFKFPFGVAAIAALIHDVTITIGVISVANAEFSLPIVAALLTIIGYSINDTIVVFDRIRENMPSGLVKKSFEDRVNSSINQTLGRTIMTSFTTFLVIITLYVTFFGSGDVMEDFALALLVGVVIGTYSSICIASPILVLWNRKWPMK
jgi:preprotein translocase subunit SecF